jgi:sulfur-oxidizing protein SoxX
MKLSRLLAPPAAAAVLAGCATAPSPQASPAAASAELDKLARQVIAASFRDQGIARADRLKQDLAQSACSHEDGPDDATAQRIRKENLATVRWPADGQYFGDWREGEKIAQSGRGMTWTDPSADPKTNGGGCYNCHQIDKKEIAHGTIGPTLWNYGRKKGVTDLAAPAAAEAIRATWGRLWNSKAYAECSTMPRFGHMNLLDEQQLRHLMSLLLDPKSPVNR